MIEQDDAQREVELKGLCATCRFWNCEFPAWHGSHDCRRHAPVVSPTDSRKPRWPDTDSRDWCGDWEHGEKKR